MGFPRGKGRDTGLTRGCAAAELPVTQSAPSALRVVSLGLYSHRPINPWDSLILQSSFPAGRLLPSRGAEQPGERGAGGGAGWARCQARRGAGSAGLPGSQAGLPVCSARGAPPAPRLQAQPYKDFSVGSAQNAALSSTSSDNRPAGASSPRAGGIWEGDCRRHSGAQGSHTRWWPVFNGTLTAFVPQAARETAAEQEAAELPLPPARGGFSQQ